MTPNRRSVLATLVAAFATARAPTAVASADGQQVFVDAAFAMKREAEQSGDQPYGAVIVRDGAIVGWGPSRVVVRKDPTAHAEREAIRDAQARLGARDLSGCLMYSTSRPCADCERAAAEAGLARMIFGADARDTGPPRRP